MVHTVKVAIEAPSRDEAEDEVNDLLAIGNALNKTDRKILVKLLKEKPGIVQTAKNFLGK